MNNNLPAIRKNGFFEKVCNFIRNVFIRKNYKGTNVNNKTDIQDIKDIRRNVNFISEKDKVDTLQKTKELYKEMRKKEELYKMIKNVELVPETINYMSIEELKTIKEYYNNEILTIKRKILEKS